MKRWRDFIKNPDKYAWKGLSKDKGQSIPSVALKQYGSDSAMKLVSVLKIFLNIVKWYGGVEKNKLICGTTTGIIVLQVRFYYNFHLHLIFYIFN